MIVTLEHFQALQVQRLARPVQRDSVAQMHRRPQLHVSLDITKSCRCRLYVMLAQQDVSQFGAMPRPVNNALPITNVLRGTFHPSFVQTERFKAFVVKQHVKNVLVDDIALHTRLRTHAYPVQLDLFARSQIDSRLHALQGIFSQNLVLPSATNALQVSSSQSRTRALAWHAPPAKPNRW